MSKPDWAERLQRSRNRMYEKGWADCEARIVADLESYATDLRKYNPISGEERAKMIEYAIERITPSGLIKGETE